MCGLFISHKFKVHISDFRVCPVRNQMWSSWSLGRYIEYLMHFIVSRAHLGQLINNLAKVGYIHSVLGHSRHHASNRNIVTCSMGKAEEYATHMHGSSR